MRDGPRPGTGYCAPPSTFADDHGIGSLTMRKLGEALGVEAMSLYNHVANKDDLLDGMVDLVFGEIDLPAADARLEGRDADRAIAVRHALGRHRWAIGLMESRTSPGPGDPAPPRRRARLPSRGRASPSS